MRRLKESCEASDPCALASGLALRFRSPRGNYRYAAFSGDFPRKLQKSLVERENYGHEAFSVQDVIAELELQRAVGLHHFDVLFEEKMIDWVNPGVKCVLRALGRTYAVKYLLEAD